VVRVSCLAAWVVFGAADAPHARAQTAPAESRRAGIIGEAEITANDVYVRSGDSLNHYTICKLKAGDRVTVVGERGEWYEILPPEGTFSLLSGDYVDTTDNQKGVVNGNNVRVRAGSLLNENKYTVQALLSKGVEVTILGRNPDGFLRIKPPQGATVWVSRAFAQLRSDSRPTSAQGGDTATPSDSTGAAPATSPASTSASADGPTTGPRTIGTPTPGTSNASKAASSGDVGAWQKKLDELDFATNKELEKPVVERHLDQFIAKYREASEQANNELVRQYAQRRIEEISTTVEAATAYHQLKKLDDIAETRRREFRSSRAGIPEATPTFPSGIEAKGELRVSALFPPGSTPQRYRLIDPSVAGGRTIGYVEIPPDSPIKAGDFLGRYVGVRALERRVQSGGVDPVPIYVTSELVLLEPPAAPGAAETGN
jgi:uncharacterized protein YgiM (DUF1202 family)